MFDWTVNSWIIVITGFLAAASCSVLGVFLVLRRMSLVADAISHAVLPGIAIAFLIAGDRATLPMLLGAGLMGLFATFLIEWIHRAGKVQADAAIGVVFTALFALGVVIISAKAGMVDLDQDCVLYGEIAYTPWDELVVGGASLGPRPLWILGFITVLNFSFVVLFFKELKLSTFDSGLATALGFNAVGIYYSLMGLVSLTTVASFDSVGAILVIAMFVVPAATAYLLSDRLSTMIILAVIVSAAISVFGYAMANWIDASIAGSMTVIAGLLFTLVFFLSPRHGLLFRWWVRFELRLRIAVEDRVAQIYRINESDKVRGDDPITSKLSGAGWLPIYLRHKDLVTGDSEAMRLTEKGEEIARSVVRRHRSWEGYLHDEHAVPADHVHRPAHEIEHFLEEGIEDIGEVVSKDRKDPHGSEIPD